ncbi:MAG: zinc ABC transporter substrate-binding protein [Bacteroidia bacterium]|nr:zinc ABC transporter substrate-binding protein [Bacteroidia bacterium]MDW8158982.1 zinc ABC transporter substrate-binding protein [Bacteroidia bacterium]
MKILAAFRLCLLCLFIGYLGIGCKQSSKEKVFTHSSSLRIVATTGIVGDAVKNIVLNKAEVNVLMGPGVDPHLYKASQKDLELLSKADVIFYNGLHLEGKMAEVLEKLKKQKKIVAIAEAIPVNKLIKVGENENLYDPHVWMDVSLWKYAVIECARVLQSIDTSNAAFYKQNLDNYLQALDSLDAYIETEIAKIPSIPRVLITAHDAFSYFSRRYHIEVKSLQGISTVAEFGLRDITNLVDFIVARKIKAVFMESFIPERSIRAVIEGCKAKNHEVKLGGVLFTDALGAEGTPEGTYIGMLKANVKTITDGLR